MKYEKGSAKLIYMSADVRNHLESASEQGGVSAASIVSEALEKHLPKVERRIKSKKGSGITEPLGKEREGGS